MFIIVNEEDKEYLCKNKENLCKNKEKNNWYWSTDIDLAYKFNTEQDAEDVFTRIYFYHLSKSIYRTYIRRYIENKKEKIVYEDNDIRNLPKDQVIESEYATMSPYWKYYVIMINNEKYLNFKYDRDIPLEEKIYFTDNKDEAFKFNDIRFASNIAKLMELSKLYSNVTICTI